MYPNRTALLSLTLTLCAACVQAADIEKLVDYRQGVMNVYAYHTKSMAAMVKGKTAFDSAAFAHHAENLAVAARLDLLAGFPEDSINEESDAGDTIWLAWDEFQQGYEALQAQSAKLAEEAAAGGDEAAMKEQFGKTAKTCKGCHDDFKN